MLGVVGLRKHFGGLRAVDGASFEIAGGSVTGVIGPNGAGKSVLFNVICGLLRPTGGRVLLDGRDITGLPPHELYLRGVLRTFQLAHEFPTLTVLENLMTAAGGQSGESLASAWLGRRRVREEEAAIRRRAEEVAGLLNLSGLAGEPAGNLSGGQKKLLEFGRVMMADARIVFLDEAGAGVNRALLATIGDAIRRLNRERGCTFCIIEHDMEFIARMCDPVIVMAEGGVLVEGGPEKVLTDRRVVAAYLGGGRRRGGDAAA